MELQRVAIVELMLQSALGVTTKHINWFMRPYTGIRFSSNILRAISYIKWGCKPSRNLTVTLGLMLLTYEGGRVI